MAQRVEECGARTMPGLSFVLLCVFFVTHIDATSPTQASDSEAEAHFMKAVLDNDMDTIMSLIQRGVSPNIKNEDTNSTPLHLACNEGFDSIVALLLEHQADVWAQNNIGLTPLHYAAFHGHVHAIQLLLAAGAMHTANLQDQSAKTALDLAKKNNHFAVIDLLEPHTEMEWSLTNGLESKEALSTIILSVATFMAAVYWVNASSSRGARPTAGQRARAVSAESRKIKKRGKM